MNNNKRWIFLLMLLVLLFTPKQTSAATVQKTVELENKETNVQIIVEGENDNFEVEIKLPNGQSVTKETQKEEEQIYVPMINKRVWVIRDAPKGTYTLTISGDTEQNFNAYTKEALETPKMVWETPKDQVLTVIDSESFDLSWSTTGDVSDEQVYFSMSNGAVSFELGETDIRSNRFTLGVPQNVPNGVYDLLVHAEVGPSEVDVEINVTIEVKRGTDGTPEFRIIEQDVENGNLLVDLVVPKHSSWEFVGFIKNEAGEIIREVQELDDHVMVLEEDEDHITYRWIIGTFEEGSYSGSVYGIYNGSQATEIVNLEEFKIVPSKWTNESIKWSIDQDLTNLRVIEFSLDADEGTLVAVYEDQQGILEETVTSDLKEFAIPLTEGHHLYSVVVKDPNGNTHTFEKVIQVDHTAPRLEMIQPLQSHESALDGFASGFVEPGSILKIDGKEIEYDENGYFKVDIGGSFTLSLTDKAGNLTEYTWEKHNSNNKWLMIFIGINIVIIGAAAIVVFFLRKTK